MTDEHVPVLAVVGYGFIGRRVARNALHRGWQVRALARRPSGRDETPVTMTIGEAHDPDALRSVVERAQHVVFAAGTTKPADSNEDPVADAVRNISPLVATLEVMAASGAHGFTFLSSGGAVYGPGAPVPTPEHAPLWPISSYGIMKVAAERYVAMYARRLGFAADILRCANVYGPGEPTVGSQGLIGIAREAIREGRELVVYGDGSARRDYLHVDDLASAVMSLAEDPRGTRILNVGSGHSTSTLDVVHALAAAAGREPFLRFHPMRPSDAPIAELDIDALRAEIPFDPRDAREWLAEQSGKQGLPRTGIGAGDITTRRERTRP